MGNYASCTLSLSPPAKVILPTHLIRVLKNDTKAAELMMEFPSYFLVNSSSMRIGRRFSALSADEDLELGNVYVMFPMRRVNTRVLDDDVAMLENRGGTVKNEEMMGLVCNFEGVEGLVVEDDFKYRVSLCRSRKPNLETIKEEPVC